MQTSLAVNPAFPAMLTQLFVSLSEMSCRDSLHRVVLICAVFILPYKADTTSSLKDFIACCRGGENQGYTIIIQYGGAA